MNIIETGIIIADMKKDICVMSYGVGLIICIENEKIPNFIHESVIAADRKSNVSIGGRDYIIEFSHKTKEDHNVFMISDIARLKCITLENKILNKSIEYINDAIYAIDREGRELVLNRIERFMPIYKDKLIREMMEVFETGQSIPGNYNKYISQDHKEIHMLSTLVPVKEGDEVVAVLLINRYLNRVQETLARVQNLKLKNRDYSKAKLPDNNTSYTFEDIIGESKVLNEVKNQAMRASTSNIPILIQGETGTGKELFAQSIHNAGSNAEKQFLAINCAAIPGNLLESILFGTKKGIYTGAENTEGLMEQTGEGTLFLDEINSMSIELQAKMLRALQEKKVRRLGSKREIPIKCRIISSINENPEKLISEGKLRKDFFYRIAALTLIVPPLRERGKDILLLSKVFIERYSRIYGKFVTGMSPQLEELFMMHKWPGNIRELVHIIESSLNFIDTENCLTTRNLPNYFQIRTNESKLTLSEESPNTGNLEMKADSLPKLLNEIEKGMILNTLKKNEGNITKSAEALGIKRQNLQSRMNKLKISKSVAFKTSDKE